MRQDVQRAPVGAADNELQRTFGDVDAADRPAPGIVDEDLAVRDVEIARGILRDALAAAVRDHLEIGDAPRRADQPAIGAVLRPVGQHDSLAGPGGDEAVRV